MERFAKSLTIAGSVCSIVCVVPLIAELLGVHLSAIGSAIAEAAAVLLPLAMFAFGFGVGWWTRARALREEGVGVESLVELREELSREREARIEAEVRLNAAEGLLFANGLSLDKGFGKAMMGAARRHAEANREDGNPAF